MKQFFENFAEKLINGIDLYKERTVQGNIRRTIVVQNPHPIFKANLILSVFTLFKSFALIFEQTELLLFILPQIS